MSDRTLKEKIARTIIRFRKRKQVNSSQNINYNKAEIVGVIYRRVNKTGSSQVEDFIEKLQNDGKKVFSLEYIAKEIDSDYHLKELNHIALRDEDLNIFKIPKKVIFNNFCNKKFDMIINLSLANHPQLHYVSALCSSSMKVGFFFEGFSDYYDFMVDAKGSLDFKEHLSTMLKFIKQIDKN